MKEKFRKEWLFSLVTIICIGVLLVYGVVMIYSIYDPKPDSELIVGRAYDLMLMVVGFVLGAVFGHSRTKTNNPD